MFICNHPLHTSLKNLHHSSHWSKTWLDRPMNFVCKWICASVACCLIILLISHIYRFCCFFREGQELKRIRILNASWSHRGEMSSLRFLGYYVRGNLRLHWNLFSVCSFLKVKIVVWMPSSADNCCNMKAELSLYEHSFIQKPALAQFMLEGGGHTIFRDVGNTSEEWSIIWKEWLRH